MQVAISGLGNILGYMFCVYSGTRVKQEKKKRKCAFNSNTILKLYLHIVSGNFLFVL